MITDIFIEAIIDFVKILPILIIAIVASQMINAYLPKKKIAWKETEKNMAKASVIGIVTPGPLIAFLPILKALKNKGMPLAIIAAFITAQTLIGPARLFLEIGYFGAMFFVYRVIIAFFTALAIATCFRVLERFFILN